MPARTAKKDDAEHEVGVRTKLEFEKPRKGDTEVEAYGQKWGPIACGPHNSVPPFDANAEGKGYETVDVDGREHIARTGPAGFQPSCDDCQAELDGVLDHARRHATV